MQIPSGKASIILVVSFISVRGSHILGNEQANGEYLGFITGIREQ